MEEDAIRHIRRKVPADLEKLVDERGRALDAKEERRKAEEGSR